MNTLMNSSKKSLNRQEWMSEMKMKEECHWRIRL